MSLVNCANTPSITPETKKADEASELVVQAFRQMINTRHSEFISLPYAVKLSWRRICKGIDAAINFQLRHRYTLRILPHEVELFKKALTGAYRERFNEYKAVHFIEPHLKRLEITQFHDLLGHMRVIRFNNLAITETESSPSQAQPELRAGEGGTSTNPPKKRTKISAEYVRGENHLKDVASLHFPPTVIESVRTLSFAGYQISRQNLVDLFQKCKALEVLTLHNCGLNADIWQTSDDATLPFQNLKFLYVFESYTNIDGVYTKVTKPLMDCVFPNAHKSVMARQAGPN